MGKDIRKCYVYVEVIRIAKLLSCIGENDYRFKLLGRQLKDLRYTDMDAFNAACCDDSTGILMGFCND